MTDNRCNGNRHDIQGSRTHRGVISVYLPVGERDQQFDFFSETITRRHVRIRPAIARARVIDLRSIDRGLQVRVKRQIGATQEEGSLETLDK